MAKYINVDEIEKLVNSDNPMHLEEISIYSIRKIPAEDVRPVKHGKWIEPDTIVKGLFNNWFTCSECGTKSCILGNYCHSCGARMSKE